jgi:two-component system, OmpR family, sensor kinase
MSLRIRLTVLYSIIVIGGLLIFGSLAYGLVSLTLLSQVDQNLNEAASSIISLLRINQNNQLDIRPLVNQRLPGDLLFQVRGQDGELYYSNISGWAASTEWAETLDSEEIAGTASVQTVSSPAGNLRVMSIPIETARRPVGTLLVAQPLTLIEAAQQRLVNILLALGVLFVPLSALAAWFITRQALRPLIEMSAMATRITKADDLNLRIAVDGHPDDEVGQLMQAFNQTMERLENLFNAQNRFITDVSHDLRTPLTVIKGNVGLMKRLGCGDDESLDSISAEVDRLTRLVGDLLLLAQAETGHLPLNIQVVELDTVFLEVFGQMKMLAGQRINLQIEDMDQVRVKGDPDRLKQVIVNLVANAIQHTPSSGDVTIKLGKTDGMGLFQVQDTGPGIPKEDLPFIFERFYRGEKSRVREKSSGFGLGLSIVRWIVNNHQGKIEVESEPDQGTTFRVYLPLWDDPNQWEPTD